MKANLNFKILGVIICLCFISACAAGSGFVHPRANFNKVGRLAVVVNSANLTDLQKQETADLFSMALLKKGFLVIDRANLDQIAQEADFQNAAEFTTGKGAAQLRIHNVKTLVIVNVDNEGSEVSMTAKMTMLETGSLVWMGEGTGDSKKGWAALGGGLLGASVGGLVGTSVGSKDSSSAKAGALVGGATGAVIGAALDPSKKKLYREVIEKTTESIPFLTAG
ncbi:glycine zipper domain-containing protein [Dethiosulfatarculus sandiegensis]|uniref:Glycine zipper domain-containing protein n=1 Tax=Dethiosulfatarculus sandiegensis TaxID=1429043 RepID=A0A0D2K2S5_9BACT|nr:glycine zipper domain-containing protein [Dethiosulfatarculus sandiegensis]KIX15920.1 hypothetical protein X474_01220 [Dethiosulfatarculus sandiegensis]